MDLNHVIYLRGKKANTGVFLEVLRLRHADTLSLLLVNCHDVTAAIFDRGKSPLKWHNQPGQKLKDLRKSKVQTTTTTTKVLNTIPVVSHQPPALFSSVMCISP